MRLWHLEISWRPPVGTSDRQLARLYRDLRRLGVPRDAAKSTVDDLRGDLPAAGSLAALTGGDLHAFATSVAREHGRAPVPARHWLIVPLMAAPMLLVAFLTYVFVAGGGQNLGLDYHTVTFVELETTQLDGGARTNEVESELDEWKPLIAVFVSTVLGVGGAFGLAAVALAAVRDSRIAATFVRMLVTLPVGGIAGVTAAILVGVATNYNDDASVIALEVLVASAFIAAGMVVAREWARRLPRHSDPAAGPPPRLVRSPDA